MRNTIWNTLFLCLSLGILAAFLNLARYALPKTDDFSLIMYGFNNLEAYGNIIRSTLHLVKDMYLQQQGTFTSSLAADFLLVKIGTNLHRYQLVTAVFVVLAFFSYMVLLRKLATHFHFQPIWGVFLFCTLWVAVDLIGPGEPMLYIVGACVYCFPLSLGFLATTCYLNLMETEHKGSMLLWGILSAGFGFFSAGGVLMVAAMVNSFFVWIILLEWFRNKKIPFRGMIPFLFTFGGALINALAPGNFTRYEASTGSASLDIGRSILHTLVITFQYLFQLGTRTYFLVAILLLTTFVILVPTDASKEHFRMNPIFLVIASYSCCYLATFPTVLGYHLTPGDQPQDRMLFTFSWIASMLVFLTWAYLLMWLKVRYFQEQQWSKASFAIAGVALLGAACINLWYLPKFRPEGTAPTLTSIYQEMRDGYLDNYYAAYHLALLGADSAPQGSAYYIFYEFPETRLFMESSMSAYPDWWVNRAAAATYQLGLFDYCPDHPFSEQDVLDAGYTMEQLLP